MVMDDDNRPADLAGWENLDEHEKDIKIGDSLKHMGNVKRRKMTSFILKDLIGDEGRDAVKGIKKGHDIISHELRCIQPRSSLPCRYGYLTRCGCPQVQCVYDHDFHLSKQICLH